jgi:hypothetical protein
MKETMPPNSNFEEEMRKDEVVGLYRRLLDQQPPEVLDKRVVETYRRIMQSDLLSPEEKWLNAIIELLEAGQVAEAEVQIKAFRQQYPDYKKSPSR